VAFAQKKAAEYCYADDKAAHQLKGLTSQQVQAPTSADRSGKYGNER
jgi:hypothetical protein